MRPPIEHTDPRLLVFGQLAGAHALNMRVIEALPHLADLRESFASPTRPGPATAITWSADTAR